MADEEFEDVEEFADEGDEGGEFVDEGGLADEGGEGGDEGGFADTGGDGDSFGAGFGGSHTEVTHESWFGRIMASIKSVVFGVILFLVAFPVLFFNEGRAVKTAKGLEEGAGAVISVASDKVDSANEGKLVHVSGRATTEEVLADDDFGIAENAIHLDRRVEMYQWQEKTSSKTKKNVGGSKTTTTTYKYAKIWSGAVINSSRFKKPTRHRNPGRLPFNARTVSAKKVTVGAFQLSATLIDEIGNYAPLAVGQQQLAKAAASGKTGLRISGGSFYRGNDPAAPRIGDVRISFRLVKPTDVSIVARQTGEAFAPYPTKAGRNIQNLRIGTVSADAMFQQMKQSNTIITWVLRLVGFLLMLIGLSMIFSPIPVVADVIPFFGDMLRFGIGLFAFVVAALLSLFTIAVAWIFFRPLLGIGLIVLAIVIAVGGKQLARSKPAAAA